MNFKIRAWDQMEEQMLQVGLLDINDPIYYNLRNENFTKTYSSGFKRHNELYLDDKPWGDPNDLVIMLYSDHVDYKGNRLCDGDIVLYSNEPCLVIYQGSCFYIQTDGWILPLSATHHRGMKLIGNIYENPELIRDQDDQQLGSKEVTKR